MTTGRDSLVNPPRRLPDLALPAARNRGGEALHPLRPPGRRAPVLVLAHGHDCAACAEFVARLEESREELTEWDAHCVVVLPEPASDAADFPHRGVPLLADPERRVAAALAVEPPALVIADQWGEIHALERAGEEHAFPEVEEIVAWARYLAIQCPECQGEAY